MSYGGLIRFSDILKTASTQPAIKNGCLVDTSILFAASYPLDKFNSEAEELFDFLAELKIPVYTNVNIRSEFLDLHRRVMIPEGLSDLYTTYGNSLDPALYKKVQSVYSSLFKSKNTGSPYKFSEKQIKEWRLLLKSYKIDSSNGWLKFCADLLQNRIEKVWDETCNLLDVNFLSLRDDDHSDWVENHPTWEGVTEIVGKYGVGSFDAMIANLFRVSKFSMLITADKDLAYVVDELKPNDKFVCIPSSLDF